MARSRRSSASPAATSSRRATCSRTSASATTTRPDLGTVKLDNMDTIYKEYGQVEEIFGLTSGNFISPSNVLSHIGIGNNNAARFHERAPNSIQYQTPQIAGFQGGVQYSPEETKKDVV